MVSFLSVLNGCFDFAKVIKENEKEFNRVHSENKKTVSSNGFEIFYAIKRSENPKNPVIVFVHGSPGEWNAYAHLMNDSLLSKAFTMITFDRPGFGNTLPKKPEPSLANQAAFIPSILRHERITEPVVVFGHSYGGPVALQFANDYPKQTQALVLVASPADPTLEKPLWYNKFASWKIIRWMIPKTLRFSNDEIMPLGPELNKLKNVWTNDTLAISLVHGGKDNLVPFKHTEFVEKQVSRQNLSTYYDSQADHFILWTDQELMRKVLLDLVNSH